MKKEIGLVLILFVILTCINSYAARPLSTEDTGTVDAGHLEIELGYEFSKMDSKEHTLSFVSTFGILQNLDASIEAPYLFIKNKNEDDENGFGDLEMGVKLRLLEEKGNIPSLALKFKIKTDTGDESKRIGSDNVDYQINSILSKNFTKNTLHLNIGYTFIGEISSDDVFNYSFALENPVNDKLNLVGELSAETTFEGGFDDNPFEVLLGFNYALPDISVIDAGISIGLSNASPDYKITSGITIGF